MKKLLIILSLLFTANCFALDEDEFDECPQGSLNVLSTYMLGQLKLMHPKYPESFVNTLEYALIGAIEEGVTDL